MLQRSIKPPGGSCQCVHCIITDYHTIISSSPRVHIISNRFFESSGASSVAQCPGRSPGRSEKRGRKQNMRLNCFGLDTCTCRQLRLSTCRQLSAKRCAVVACSSAANGLYSYAPRATRRSPPGRAPEDVQRQSYRIARPSLPILGLHNPDGPWPSNPGEVA